jgi:hypothetical protein
MEQGMRARLIVPVLASSPVSDQAVRVVSINNEYNVSIAVVHRAKKGPEGGGAIEHSQAPDYLVVRVDPHKVLPAGYGVK